MIDIKDSFFTQSFFHHKSAKLLETDKSALLLGNASYSISTQPDGEPTSNGVHLNDNDGVYADAG